MRHFLLSTLLAGVLIAFGYCFLLAGQLVVSVYKLHTLQTNGVIDSIHCTVSGTVANCKTSVRF